MPVAQNKGRNPPSFGSAYNSAGHRITHSRDHFWGSFFDLPLTTGRNGRRSRTPAKPQPKHNQRHERARGIEQRIINRRTTAGHERLMKLVGKGVTRGDEQRGGSPGPAPSLAASAHGAVE